MKPDIGHPSTSVWRAFTHHALETFGPEMSHSNMRLYSLPIWDPNGFSTRKHEIKKKFRAWNVRLEFQFSFHGKIHVFFSLRISVKCKAINPVNVLIWTSDTGRQVCMCWKSILTVNHPALCLGGPGNGALDKLLQRRKEQHLGKTFLTREDEFLL